MSDAGTSAPRRPRLSPLHPLDDFYALSGRPLPSFQEVEPGALPEPQRKLLVHSEDLTPTEEKFYNCGLLFKVLSRRRAGSIYSREVVLRLDDPSHRAIEFSAIRYDLALFPPEAREDILREREPLGRIMASHRLPHTSRPSAFFRLESDDLINGVLELMGAQVLYARRNTLLDPQKRSLAEIVEIMAPTGLAGR